MRFTNESHKEGEVALSRETTEALRAVMDQANDLDDESLSRELLSWFENNRQELETAFADVDARMSDEEGEDDESDPMDDLADMDIDSDEKQKNQDQDDIMSLDVLGSEDDDDKKDKKSSKGPKIKAAKSDGGKKKDAAPEPAASKDDDKPKEKKSSNESVWRSLLKRI